MVDTILSNQFDLSREFSNEGQEFGQEFGVHRDDPRAGRGEDRDVPLVADT